MRGALGGSELLPLLRRAPFGSTSGYAASAGKRAEPIAAPPVQRSLPAFFEPFRQEER